MPVQKRLFIVLVLLAAALLPRTTLLHAETTGVLFLHVGEPEFFRCDSMRFQRNLFDILPPGFFAGSDLEGGDCYSLIHYADEAEAAVCGVEEGAAVDPFCNRYLGSEPVHAITDHGFFGDRTFGAQCGRGLFPYVLIASDTSRDPVTGEEIPGPHVDDPAGPGIGIPEFMESFCFDLMDVMYRIPGNRNPQREQLLRWWYGNDGQGQQQTPFAAANVKNMLTERFPGREFVFRHGWEFYLRNEDVYGNPAFYPDSAETALRELIDDAGASSIVVFHSYPGFSNFAQYGHEWYDADGRGVSALDGKTFKQCVTDLGDGAGPASLLQLRDYLTWKPWDKHADHTFPLIQKLAAGIDPSVALAFAPAYGSSPAFGHAVLALLQHTVQAFSIPPGAALKVLLVHHGFGAGYAGAQTCDCYNRNIEQLYENVRQQITGSFAWEGRFELAHGAGEFAEGSDDPATLCSPFGAALGMGEHIDTAINGTYVSQTGIAMDNGLDNFDYIVAIPYFFDAESYDTLYEKRLPLGNNIPGADGAYVRDSRDEDGTDYDADDYDSEYRTVKVYDGTGWPSRPRFGSQTVYKGSRTRPTTLILTGALLSADDGGTVQQHLAGAAVDAIAEALQQLSGAAR